MYLHSMYNEVGTRKNRKRLGRGRSSGTGKTSGHGHKGQYARKGHKHKLGFEGGQMPLMRRLPKRGFNNPARVEWTGVNVASLNRFDDGATVDARALVDAGLVAPRDAARIKILGSGELQRKVTVRVGAYSAAAREKIAAAGGSCETV